MSKYAKAYGNLRGIAGPEALEEYILNHDIEVLENNGVNSLTVKLLRETGVNSIRDLRDLRNLDPRGESAIPVILTIRGIGEKAAEKIHRYLRSFVL